MGSYYGSGLYVDILKLYALRLNRNVPCVFFYMTNTELRCRYGREVLKSPTKKPKHEVCSCSNYHEYLFITPSNFTVLSSEPISTTHRDHDTQIQSTS